MVVVRVLGPVEVVDSAGNVHLVGSALRRTLLALLALRAGEVVRADWLLEHVWAGEPPESGLRALRVHISRLRKELGENAVIETRSGGYRLVVSADQVDALAVERLADVARHESDPDLTAQMCATALAMWRGEPFADTALCSALDNEAGRLDAVRIALVEDRFRALLDAGGGGELVADLLRATAQYPLREALWSMLITAQYRAGLQADALRSYEHMRTMLSDDLGLDPSSELQDLQRRVLQHDPALGNTGVGVHRTTMSGGDRSRGNLPISATPLIDSDDQVGLSRTQLQRHRLITLTGTGGVGKTRLAIELGRSCLHEFNAGVWLVELAPVADSDAVAATVASVLQIRPQPNSTLVESIVDWFTARELLLIVDNCEHVLDPVRSLINVLLARCPTIKVVATSREPLGSAGEHVHPVHVLNPMSDGVTLFLDRAVAADSSFAMSELEHEPVTEICRRLDGLPLAIELAAARVRSMAPVDLLARLDDRFRLLRGVPRYCHDHHQTLLATVEWSYRLSNQAQRTLFDRLSVFAGGWDLRAAEAVCAADVIDEAEVVDLLGDLVDKSMVVADRQPDGTRYRMLETLRQFAEDQLRDHGDIASLRGRHLRHYLDIAEGADDLYRGERQVAAVATFEAEWDNLRRAHETAIFTDDLRSAERLLWASRLYAWSRMRVEHGDWAEQTIALEFTTCPPTPNTFAQAGYWAFISDDMTRLYDLLDRGIDHAVSMDDPSVALCLLSSVTHQHPRITDYTRQLEVVVSKIDLDREWWILIELANIAYLHDPLSAPTHITRILEAADRVRTPTLMAAAMSFRGHRALNEDPPDFAVAQHYYGHALHVARQSGDLLAEGDALRAVALATVGLRPDKAIEACREALAYLYEIRYWRRIWQLCESVALTLALTAQRNAAAVVVGHLQAHSSTDGFEEGLGYRARTLEIIRAHSEADMWMARGAALDRHQIVQYALAATEQQPTAAAL